MSEAEPVLVAEALVAGYGLTPAVRGVDLAVGAGEIVALLGPNGAGKTTTLLTLAGQLSPTAGFVRVGGADVTGWPTHRLARHGLGMVADDRVLISSLTVRETFKLVRNPTLDPIELFPPLADLLGRPCGLLSGGEQQMVAIARAASVGPRILLIDELSQGLAPIIVHRLLESLRRIVDRTGMGVLLVEQHLRVVLGVADRGYLLAKGRVVLERSADDLLGRIDDVEAAYLGAAV